MPLPTTSLHPYLCVVYTFAYALTYAQLTLLLTLGLRPYLRLAYAFAHALFIVQSSKRLHSAWQLVLSRLIGSECDNKLANKGKQNRLAICRPTVHSQSL